MSSTTPVISISIVSWNCLDELRACLDSIHTQQGAPAYETIVVDNNSADQTAAYVAKHYPWVRLVANTKNVGFGRAHNQAAKLAKGEWLFVLNPDTVLRQDTLAKFYEAREQASLIAPQLQFVDGALQRSAHRRWPSAWSHFYLYNFFVFVLWQRLIPGYDPTLYSVADHTRVLQPRHVMGAAMFVNAESFHDLGGFDEGFFLYLEETDLCYRLWAAGHEVVYLPEVVITHQLGSSIQAGAIGQVSPYYLSSAYLYFTKRHGALPARLLFAKTRIVLAVNRVLLSALHAVWPKQAKIQLGLEFTARALAWHNDHVKDYR